MNTEDRQVLRQVRTEDGAAQIADVGKRAAAELGVPFAAAVAYYRDRFGFDAPHKTGDFAVIVRDDAVLHLWGATDDDWVDLVKAPVRVRGGKQPLTIPLAKLEEADPVDIEVSADGTGSVTSR